MKLLKKLKIFNGLLRRLDFPNSIQHLPKNYYPKKAGFLAVGNDAHLSSNLSSNIGTHALIKNSLKKNRERPDCVFNRIVTSRKLEVILRKKRVPHTFNLILNIVVAYHEILLRKKFKGF